MRHVAVKLLGAAATLLALATAVFFMLKLAPGDEAVVAAGPGATAEQVAQTRIRLGLDDPLPVQYLRYLRSLAQGDLGVSSATHGSVGAMIAEVIPSTAELVATTVVIGVSVSLPLALLSASQRAGWSDSARRLIVIFAAGIPTFWLALILQLTLATELQLLPISGRLSEGYDIPVRTGGMVVDSLLAGRPDAAWDALQHLVLPACALAVPFAGLLYRLVRAELISVLDRDHVMVARAVGIPQRSIVRRYVLPHALTPALILTGVTCGTLFGEAILVESIFGRDGLGSLMTNAVLQKDIPTVQAGVLVIGVIVIIANLLVDVVQVARDPRLRTPGSRR